MFQERNLAKSIKTDKTISRERMKSNRKTKCKDIPTAALFLWQNIKKNVHSQVVLPTKLTETQTLIRYTIILC